MKKSYFYDTYKPLKFKEGFTLLPILHHPKSRGFIKLKSRDPFTPPAIVPNYFSEQSDVDTLIKGIKECLRLGKTYPFKRFGAKFYSKPNPICKKYHKPFSDQYWECVARHFTYQVYHDVGTCRMGPIDDPHGAVVNERYLEEFLEFMIRFLIHFYVLIKQKIFTFVYFIGYKFMGLVVFV